MSSAGESPDQGAEVLEAPKAKRARKARAPKPPKAPKPGRRQYGEASDGRPVVSVTELGALLGLKTHALMRWTAMLTADACANAIAGGASYQDAIEHAKRAAFARRDEAAEAGTLAHAMCSEFVCGRDPEQAIDAFAAPDVQETARRAFDRFASWWRDCGYRLHLSEEQLVDRDAGIGGTLDLVLVDAEGNLIIADIKTGKDVHIDVVVQLAGYARLLRTVRGEHVVRGMVIHAPADGELQIVGVTAEALEAGGRVFDALVAIHKAKSGLVLAKGVAA